TIVFATHYLREADDYADRVVLLRQGEVVADGSVDDMTAGLHKTLGAQWISATDPHAWARSAGIEATHFTYDVEQQRIRIVTADADRLAADRLAAGLIRNLPIVQPGIEDAFFAITKPAQPPVVQNDSTAQEIRS